MRPASPTPEQHPRRHPGSDRPAPPACAGLPVHEALNRLELAATDAARSSVDFRISPGGSEPALAPVDLAATVRESWRHPTSLGGRSAAAGVVIEGAPHPPRTAPRLGHAHEIPRSPDESHTERVDAMPHRGTLTIAGASGSRRRQSAKEKARDNGGRRPPASTVASVGALVADTGVGMTAEVRQRIFDPFFTTKGPRAAAGLSVVYGIMPAPRRQIDVVSAPTRDHLHAAIPRRRRRGAAPSQSAGSRALRPRRILLIDDDPTVRQAMVELLQEVGTAWSRLKERRGVGNTSARAAWIS